MEQETEKNCFVSLINVFELVAKNSHCYEESTGYGQSMCLQAVLKFQLSLRETFSKSVSVKVIEKYDKIAFG